MDTPTEPGFYWVRTRLNDWTVALFKEFAGGSWYLPGTDNIFETEDLAEIGPRVIHPDCKMKTPKP